MSIRHRILLYFVALVAVPLFAYEAPRAEQSDEEYMDVLEHRLGKSRNLLSLLKQKGPQAYIEARGLGYLKDENRKQLIKDLMALMNNPLEPDISLDRKTKRLVIKEGKKLTTYELSDLKSGFYRDANGKKRKLDLSSYADFSRSLNKAKE